MLGEDGVKAFEGQIVTLDLNRGLLGVGSVHDRGDLSTVVLENLCVFDLVGETDQKELLSGLVTGVNNLLKDVDDKLGLRPNVLSLVEQVLDGETSLSLALHLQLNQVVDLQRGKSLVAKASQHVVLGGCGFLAATASG